MVALTPVVFHALRATFATLVADKGLPVSKLQVLLGHSAASTTAIYIRPEARTAAQDPRARLGGTVRRGTKWPGAIGGKVRDPSGKPSRPVALRATDDEREAWERAADDHGMTLAEWARASLNEMAARPRSKRSKSKP